MGLFSGLFFLWVFGSGFFAVEGVGGYYVCGDVGFGLVYVFPGFVMV